MLVPLNLDYVVFFLLLELVGDEVSLQVILLPLGWVRRKVLIVCDGLAEACDDTFQGDIDQVIVLHLDIDIESIDIVKVSVNSIFLFEIPDLVKTPVWLVMVVIVFPYSLFDLFPAGIPVSISFPQF